MKNKELKRRKLQERGITLVALVVTIIILLILAGVTLNLALGEGGIFARAKNTVDRYQAAQTNELDQLAQLEEMLNSYGQGGSTGGTGDPTPPSGGTGSSEIADKLKEFQGKYVDIGLEVNNNDNTADDWEVFYATTDRIFLIAADYVPVTMLTSCGILGRDANGFKSSGTYNVYWSSPQFLTLPTEDTFLSEVMHTGYTLNQNNNNSKAVSQLLNKDAWSVIKNKASAEKQKYIDYVIGGPTLEMWCAAWSEVVAEDDTLKTMVAEASTSEPGYKVKSNGTSGYGLYVNGTSTSEPASSKLDKYKTFFQHAVSGAYDGCYGYWLASPSAYDDPNNVMGVGWNGYVGYSTYDTIGTGVRPVVSLTIGVQLVETSEDSGIYNPVLQ